jgi:hypothetical protein
MRRRKLTIAVAGALAFVFGFLMSLRGAPAADRFDYRVRNDFFSGFGGDAEALDRGMKMCEQALSADPKNAEALVWHGSGLYFQGGMAFQSGDPQKGMELVNKGVEEMDRAVTLQPAQAGVRIPRGAVLLQSTLFMPENPMKRSLIEKGLADYETVLEMQKDRLDTLGTHPRGELLFGIAGANSRLGNEAKAQAIFERISKELDGTNYQKRADIWLKTRTLTPLQERCVGCHTPGK